MLCRVACASVLTHLLGESCASVLTHLLGDNLNINKRSTWDLIQPKYQILLFFVILNQKLGGELVKTLGGTMGNSKFWLVEWDKVFSL